MKFNDFKRNRIQNIALIKIWDSFLSYFKLSISHANNKICIIKYPARNTHWRQIWPKARIYISTIQAINSQNLAENRFSFLKLFTTFSFNTNNNNFNFMLPLIVSRSRGKSECISKKFILQLKSIEYLRWHVSKHYGMLKMRPSIRIVSKAT